MQVFGNLASPVQRKTTKAGKDYAEFRLAESTRSQPGSSNDMEPTWYTVRVIKDNVPEFVKGDFVKVTGKLKTDFYLSKEGKPSGTLLIIAFDASKVSKNPGLHEGAETASPAAPKETVKEKAPAKQLLRSPERAPDKTQVQVVARAQEQAMVSEQESDWTTLYN